ncbi:hypothetical protein L211DRAFT_199701 [Terfezia boudieri ATCC MYA-4762]|uniref:Uncharacterized protein n=1 Tax=Terfezia boudieri ATCC MYA-4762 TaxID=1051890 RepID=A0A3N4LMF4_9PEZI|nr:hypothetical protein L211DRAFT_199701 [Terfezia boudieri ATCC MYA-4762]
MRFYVQPCIAVLSCLTTYLVPVNSAPMQGRLAVPVSSSPVIIPEPRILDTLLPRSPVDYSLITIDLAKDLYNTYDEHASGIDARPNTPYRNTAPPPPPQNQNDKISGGSYSHSSGSGSGASGANTVDIRPGERDANVFRQNNAALNRPSRANTPALSNMEINSGQFPDRQRALPATAPSPVATLQ